MCIWLGKTDLVSAFRMLPTHPDQWFLLILKAENPISGEIAYFVDKCLSFGLSISCALFQHFSDCLFHILGHVTTYQSALMVTNYLDDFLFLAFTMMLCNHLIQHFLMICLHLGVLISEEKTVWASLQLVFLGILLDGECRILAVPQDKRDRAINLLLKFVQSKKATVQELQRVTGFLNFLCKAIHPSRAFTRCMYAKFHCLVNLKEHFPCSQIGQIKKDGANSAAVDTKLLALKPHHYVNLDTEFRSDCQVWLDFLESQDISVCHPFVDLNTSIQADHLFFYMDSSANLELGCGAIFQKQWLFGQWEPDFVKSCNPSIAYLELFAICVVVHAWQDQLHNLRFMLFCDNQSVVNMINQTTSKCRNCMHLIRKLTLLSLCINARIFATYVSTHDNYLADYLSRLKIRKFKQKLHDLGLVVNDQPTPMPEEFWPISKVWIK